MERMYIVAENWNTQIKYVNIKLKNRTWVNCTVGSLFHHWLFEISDTKSFIFITNNYRIFQISVFSLHDNGEWLLLLASTMKKTILVNLKIIVLWHMCCLFMILKAALQYIDGIFWLYRTSLLFLILLFTHTVIMSPLLIIIIKNLTVIPTQKCVKNLVIFEMCITLLKISWCYFKGILPCPRQQLMIIGAWLIMISGAHEMTNIRK